MKYHYTYEGGWIRDGTGIPRASCRNALPESALIRNRVSPSRESGGLEDPGGPEELVPCNVWMPDSPGARLPRVLAPHLSLNADSVGNQATTLGGVCVGDQSC